MNIRPTSPDELSDLATFLTKNGMERSPEVLRWKFRESPGQLRVTDKSFVAELGGRIVGHIGVIPTPVHLDSPHRQTLDGGWFVDWMVREDLRNRGIGILLLREAAKTCQVLMTIQGSAQTQEVLRQLGWISNRRLSVFKLNVRSGAIAAESGLSRRVLGEVSRRLYYHPVKHRPPHDWRLNDATEDHWALLDDAFDGWQRQNNCTEFHFGRSAEFLRWSFQEHPGAGYELMVADHQCQPSGYAIWRLCDRADGRRDARIVDFGIATNQPDVWRWWLGVVTERLAAEGVTQISVLSGTDSQMGGALRRNRYMPIQSLPLWTCGQADMLTEQTRWHVTFADSDIETAAAALVEASSAC